MEHTQSKNKKIILIVAVIGLAIVLISAMVLAKGKGNNNNEKISDLEGTPSEIVQKAITNTIIQLNNESDIFEQENGNNVLRDIMQSDIIGAEIELKYKDIKGLESLGLGQDVVMASKMLSGAGIKYDVAFKQDLSDFKLGFDLIKDVDSVMNIGVYKSGDVVGVASSNLFENQYTIGIDNIVENFIESDLYEELGGYPPSEEEKQEIEEGMEEFNNALEQALEPIVSEECLAQSSKIFKDFLLDCEVKEEGKDGNLTEYVLTVDGKSAAKLVKDQIELYLEQDYFKSQMDMSEVSISELDELYQDIEYAFDSMTCEVTFKVDDKFIRSMDINLFNEDIDTGFVIALAFGEDKYLSNKVEGTVTLTEYGEESQVMELVYNNNFGNKENVLTSEMDITIQDQYEYMSVDVNFDSMYDKSKKEDNLEFNLSLSTSDIGTVSLNSIGTKKVSKNEYSLENNEVTLDVEDFQTGLEAGFVFDMGMKFNKASKGDLAYKGQGKSIDILSMSAEDIYNLMDEIEGKFMSSIMGLLY